jgi:urea transporter
MPIAIGIIVLLVGGALVGSLINFGAPFLGIPFVLIFLGAVVGKEALERQKGVMQMKRFRNSARAQKVDFTPEDKRTMI